MSTNTLSDYYKISKDIEIKDDGSYYSKLELAATGLIPSNSGETPGFQLRIYLALRNSLISGEFAEYPVETVIRISPISEKYATQIFDRNSSNMSYNIDGLQELVNRLDTTVSREFKLFAGNDGRRWDFIASMDAKKAVLYIKNSTEPMAILSYLMPFIPNEIMKQVIVEEIEKKHKAGRR